MYCSVEKKAIGDVYMRIYIYRLLCVHICEYIYTYTYIQKEREMHSWNWLK